MSETQLQPAERDLYRDTWVRYLGEFLAMGWRGGRRGCGVHAGVTGCEHRAWRVQVCVCVGGDRGLDSHSARAWD